MITHIRPPQAEGPSAAADKQDKAVQDKQVEGLVSLFKLLADDTRMRILLHLSRKPEMHVRELCQRLRQSQPAVSHHLALLREARLIAMRREGRHNYYRLKPRRSQAMLRLVRSVVQTPDEEPEANGHRFKFATF